MDASSTYPQLIEQIITDYARIRYAHGDIERIPVFDRENNHYLLMIAGREGVRRIHGCIIHVDIINGKFWIQRDGTEYGIARELLDVGVPNDHIVLAFRSLEMRQYTDFATA